MRIKQIIVALAVALGAVSASAQCGIENKAFKSGEFLYYDLFFNWKFIWVKVGTASMSTVMSRYDGHPAYRASLITRSNQKLDKFFTLRDTLLSYCSTDLSPLYFRKGAREGHRYYVDEIWYSYPGNTCLLKQHRIEDDGRHEGHDHVAQQAVGGHRRDVGPEHAGNDDGRHRHGGQDADHRPLRHDLVERPQHEVDADAGRDLDYQQPQVHHRGPHLARLHAAEGDEEHQENERRGNHLSRPALQCRDGAAQQGTDDHGRRHGDGLDVAVQVFEYVHGFRFLFNDSQAPLRAQLCRGLGAASDRARRSMELPAGILPDIPAGLLAVGIGLLSGSLPGFTSRRTGGHDSNSLTLAEISLPSARPASRFDATPITLPISFIDVAPTSAMMAFTSAVSSSAVSCLGRNSS